MEQFLLQPTAPTIARNPPIIISRGQKPFGVAGYLGDVCELDGNCIILHSRCQKMRGIYEKVSFCTCSEGFRAHRGTCVERTEPKLSGSSSRRSRTKSVKFKSSARLTQNATKMEYVTATTSKPPSSTTTSRLTTRPTTTVPFLISPWMFWLITTTTSTPTTPTVTTAMPITEKFMVLPGMETINSIRAQLLRTRQQISKNFKSNNQLGQIRLDRAKVLTTDKRLNLAQEKGSPRKIGNPSNQWLSKELMEHLEREADKIIQTRKKDPIVVRPLRTQTNLGALKSIKLPSIEQPVVQIQPRPTTTVATATSEATRSLTVKIKSTRSATRVTSEQPIDISSFTTPSVVPWTTDKNPKPEPAKTKIITNSVSTQAVNPLIMTSSEVHLYSMQSQSRGSPTSTDQYIFTSKPFTLPAENQSITLATNTTKTSLTLKQLLRKYIASRLKEYRRAAATTTVTPAPSPGLRMGTLLRIITGKYEEPCTGQYTTPMNQLVTAADSSANKGVRTTTGFPSHPTVRTTEQSSRNEQLFKNSLQKMVQLLQTVNQMQANVGSE